MQTFVLLLTLGLGPGQAAALEPGDQPGADRIAQFIAGLGSTRFEDRESATQALLAIGAPALAMLRDAVGSPDLEVRRRAGEVLARIERQLESARLLGGRRVSLSFREMPLESALAELSRLAGTPYQIANEDLPLLPGRRITLETGETTWWDAYFRFCRAAGLTERLSAENSGSPIQFLVFRDIPDWPTQHAGALRIRAPVSRTPGWGMSPGVNEVSLTLEVTPEPGLGWQGIVDVRIDGAVDVHGQALKAILAPEELPPDPGNDGRFLLRRGRLRFRIELQKRPVHSVPQQWPIRLQLGPRLADSLRELHGTIIGQMETPIETLASVADLFHSAGKSFTGRDGSTLRIIDVVREREGTVRIEVEHHGPVAEDLLVNPANFRGAFNQMIWRVRADDDGGLTPQLELHDDAGRTFDIGRYNEQSSFDGNRSRYSTTLHFVPRDGTGEPARLLLRGRRTVVVEMPFTLRNVSLP